MKLLLLVLVIVGSFAQNDAHVEGNGSGDGHRHRRGHMLCSVIVFQTPNLSFDECLDIVHQTRSYCLSQNDLGEDEDLVEDSNDHMRVFQCIRDEMKAKFDYVPLREMPVEQRTEYITHECSHMCDHNEDSAPDHHDVEHCVDEVMEIVDQCIESTDDENSFRSCMHRAFHSRNHHRGRHGRGRTDNHTPGGEYEEQPAMNNGRGSVEERRQHATGELLNRRESLKSMRKLLADGGSGDDDDDDGEVKPLSAFRRRMK